MEGDCENCGRRSDDLAPVHRLYVVPESWDREGSVTRIVQAEKWCCSCRSLYPNEPVAGPA